MKTNKSYFAKLNTQQFAWLCVLIALQVVLNRLTVGTSYLQIGFGFIAGGLIGYYFGPFHGAIAEVIADIISNTLFPANGGFFFGFTLSALISGIIYGLFLYHQKITFGRILLMVTTITVVVNLLMNTGWVSIMSGVPFMTMLKIRLPKEIITLPIQTIILYFILRWVNLSKLKNKY